MQAAEAAAHATEQLRFYQQQAAEAMHARDRAHQDAADLRESNTSLEKRLGGTAAELRELGARCADLERRMAGQDARIGKLSKQAELAERLPGVERDVMRLKAELRTARGERDDVQVRETNQTQHCM